MDRNKIPPITDPKGKYWDQPKNPDNILIDEAHAVMTEEDFEALNDYSCTLPTGVYVGKMWKAQRRGKWMLVWYGEHPDPDTCSVNRREILFPLIRETCSI